MTQTESFSGSIYWGSGSTETLSGGVPGAEWQASGDVQGSYLIGASTWGDYFTYTSSDEENWRWGFTHEDSGTVAYSPDGMLITQATGCGVYLVKALFEETSTVSFDGSFIASSSGISSVSDPGWVNPDDPAEGESATASTASSFSHDSTHVVSIYGNGNYYQPNNSVKYTDHCILTNIVTKTTSGEGTETTSASTTASWYVETQIVGGVTQSVETSSTDSEYNLAHDTTKTFSILSTGDYSEEDWITFAVRQTEGADTNNVITTSILLQTVSCNFDDTMWDNAATTRQNPTWTWSSTAFSAPATHSSGIVRTLDKIILYGSASPDYAITNVKLENNTAPLRTASYGTNITTISPSGFEIGNEMATGATLADINTTSVITIEAGSPTAKTKGSAYIEQISLEYIDVYKGIGRLVIGEFIIDSYIFDVSETVQYHVPMNTAVLGYNNIQYTGLNTTSVALNMLIPADYSMSDYRRIMASRGKVSLYMEDFTMSNFRPVNINVTRNDGGTYMISMGAVP